MNSASPENIECVRTVAAMAKPNAAICCRQSAQQDPDAGARGRHGPGRFGRHLRIPRQPRRRRPAVPAGRAGCAGRCCAAMRSPTGCSTCSSSGATSAKSRPARQTAGDARRLRRQDRAPRSTAWSAEAGALAAERASGSGTSRSAAACSYLDFRFPDLDWREGRPGSPPGTPAFARAPVGAGRRRSSMAEAAHPAAARCRTSACSTSGRIMAAPWATQILADLGADVIKIERPGAGDDTRSLGSALPRRTGTASRPGRRRLLPLRQSRQALRHRRHREAARARQIVRRLAAAMRRRDREFQGRRRWRSYGLDAASLRAAEARR